MNFEDKNIYDYTFEESSVELKLDCIPEFITLTKEELEEMLVIMENKEDDE